jgi:hypothetical protein
MDDLMAAHPVGAYFGWFAAAGVMFLIEAAALGTAKAWPIFVIFGVFLPVPVILKARRNAG